MSSLAFLLAPQREIPTERDDRWMGKVQSWISLADSSWVKLWNQLAAPEQKMTPRMLPGRGLSCNAMVASFKKDPQLMESAEAWVQRAWKNWNDTGRKAQLPLVNSAAAHEALQLDSRMSLADLTGYAGGFVPIPVKKLKRGGRYAFLKNEGDSNAFAFGQLDNTQKELFLEIARGHGGDHLAVWTFGHSLNVLVARSARPGDAPALHGPFSVRARVASGSKRAGSFVEGLKTALAGSAFTPDFETLHLELEKPELSVAKCFEALGAPGARDFASPDIAAHWEDMNKVGTALLTGQPVDKKQAKTLQDLLKPFGSTKVPATGKLGKGVTGRAVGEVLLELEGALSVPQKGIWAERFRAADFYWDICDGAALDRLTAGTDGAGVGTGAAVTRLLAHFPDALARDPLFLALLGLQCEAANGHVYVEGLCKLAEQTTTAGLVLVVATASQQAALRKAFGIEAVTEASTPSGTHCGEALISRTSISKGDVAQLALSWMAKAKVTGAVAELLPDGECKLHWFKEGATAKDAKEAGLGPVDNVALRQAGERYLPRQAFVAPGAGDLLAPGEWHEGSYRGEAPASAGDHRAKKRIHANALLDKAAEPQPLGNACEILAQVGPRLRYEGPLSEADGGILSLRVAPPAADAIWLRDMRNDLKGDSVIHLYGEAWVQSGEVRGYSCSSLDVALLSQLVADAPSGTVVAIGRGADLLGAWRIR